MSRIKSFVARYSDADKDDETVLRLSDSFADGAEADIEVSVKMININYGRSRSVLDGCRPLRESTPG